jgi:hypothetical protein
MPSWSAVASVVITILAGCSSTPTTPAGTSGVPPAPGAAQAAPRKPELRAELLALRDRDQKAMGAGGAEKDAVVRAGASRLKDIVREQGWPTLSQVGKDGAQAAWLLAQHADFDPGFQQEALAHMERLAGEDEVNRVDLAYLRDRVARAKGLRQTYGTQGQCEGQVWAPFALEDPSKVDAERARMGMGPLAEYVARASRSICGSGAH